MPSVVFSRKRPVSCSAGLNFACSRSFTIMVGCSRLSKKFETPVSHELRRDGLVALRVGLQHRAVDRVVECDSSRG